MNKIFYIFICALSLAQIQMYAQTTSSNDTINTDNTSAKKAKIDNGVLGRLQGELPIDPDDPPEPLFVRGDDMDMPFLVGTKSSDFYYTDSRNTKQFTNNYIGDIYKHPTNDVFYRFTLTVPMNVTMTHEGSAVADTYMYLLDSNGNLIESNDNYDGEDHCNDTTLHSFIRRQLSAGTYYVVSEGNTKNGIIKTNITGNTSSGFNYPSIPSTYNTDPGTAVGGMGGQFGVSPMGGATYSIPIEVPQGVGGLQPQLSIVYNSQSGNGLCGFGTNLAGLSSITRGPKDIYHDGSARGIGYNADDALYLDGVRLILSSGTAGQNGAVYKPESDPFTEVLVHVTNNNTSYEVKSSDGMVYWYITALSYVKGGSQRIHSWYLTRVIQPTGNEIQYSYQQSDNFVRPVLIAYGTNVNQSNYFSNTILFTYEPRNDIIPIRFDGQQGSCNLRLKTITCKTNDEVFRTYTLNYNTTGDGTTYKYSRLTSVTEKNGWGESFPAIKFVWSFLPEVNYSSNNLQVNPATNLPSSISTDENSHIYEAGDLNGDGISDIIKIMPVEEHNGNSSVSYTAVLVFYSSISPTGQISYSTTEDYYQISFLGNFACTTLSMKGKAVVDIDGDGINELLIPIYKKTEGATRSRIFYYIIGQNYNCSNHQIICSGDVNPLFSSSDLDNDGKTEVVYLETIQTGGKYRLHVLKNTNPNTVLQQYAQYDLSIPGEPKTLLFDDWNGNGLQDLLVLTDNNYTIFWNQGDGLSSNTFSDTSKNDGSSLTYHDKLSYGDFNGDGLLDIITQETIYTGTGPYTANYTFFYYLLNNGDGGFTKVLAYSDNSSTLHQIPTDLEHFEVLDFDGDGMTDVVYTRLMYKYVAGTGTTFGAETFWMRSNGTSLEMVYSASSNKGNDAMSTRFITGDFDGDGRVELVNYGYDCVAGSFTNPYNPSVWHIYRNNALSAQTGKVTSVTGDFGSKISITYSTLTDSSVYTCGVSESYPAPRYTIPLNVVKQTVQSNGAAGSLTTQYSYEGLKIHLKGRGMLGFCKTTADCTTTGVIAESGITQWDDTFYVPKVTYSKTIVGSSMAQTIDSMTIVDKGQTKYFAYPSQTVDTDMDGNIITTVRSYDTSHGVPLSETTNYGSNMYRSVTYSRYDEYGGAYLPTRIVKSQKHSDDGSPFSTTTAITYNNAGKITYQIENYGSSDPMTAAYQYDIWGNVTYKELRGTNILDCSTRYKYDSTHRFPVRVYTTPASSVQKYTYDIWGNMLTSCDSINNNSSTFNTVTNTYDHWGNLLSSQISGSGMVTYTRGWSSDASRRLYVIEQGTGSPWVKTWFDDCGREVLVESVGPKNVTVRNSNTFNNKGQLVASTNINGNLTINHIYSYDSRGRLTQDSIPGGKTTNYQYGNRSLTYTENGTTTTKTFDAWGNIKTVTDPVSSILNTYASNGAIKTTQSGGATWTFEYDDRGNRISMSDPDAGTTSYTYDALGREKTRIDDRGVVFVTNYDYLGRIESRSADNEVTYYTYGNNGTGKLLLESESNGLWTKSYVYDPYGRVIEETMEREMESISRSKTYQYNSAGLLSSCGYPNGITVSYSYDSYGNCTGMSAATPGCDGYFTWSLTSYNGRTTTSSVGGAGIGTPYVRTTQLDSNGRLQSRTTKRQNITLQNDSYTFNGQTGNLTSRTISGVTQTFGYDIIDRLTSVTTGQNQVAMSYSSNGNLTSKSDVGLYGYDDIDHSHAVTSIERNGNIPYVDQWIWYNSWGKPYQIEQDGGVNSSDYFFDNIEYGPDQQRVLSFLSRNYYDLTVKFHWDEYEEFFGDNPTPVEAHYWIETPDGLAGMIKYTPADYYNQYHAYVASTDHLGSLTALYDHNGNKVHEASYDAWGKRTLGQTFMPLIDRGFTGHEHLDDFNLINMNGRIYDSNNCRFLSPDPFIQLPSNPQNYNRYSYCLNNPLKFTDPSGESIIAAIFIGALINAAVDYGIQVAFNYNAGLKGKDLWFNKVDFFDVAVSGIVGAVTAGYGTAAQTGVKLGKAGKWIVANGKTIKYSEMALTSLVDITGEGVQKVTANQCITRILIGFTTQAVTDAVIDYSSKKINSKSKNVDKVSKPEITDYPPNDGKLDGFSTEATIDAGTELDRYGGTGPDSRFLSVSGTDPAKRSLPPSTNLDIRDVYYVQKSFKANVSIAAPYYGQPGGGIQIITNDPIEKLIKDGFLFKLKP